MVRLEDALEFLSPSRILMMMLSFVSFFLLFWISPGTGFSFVVKESSAKDHFELGGLILHIIDLNTNIMGQRWRQFIHALLIWISFFRLLISLLLRHKHSIQQIYSCPESAEEILSSLI
jgi:hypothetical protein